MFSVGKKNSDQYASFSRRMWAVTVDSLLFMILILPVFEMVFALVYPLPVSLSEMRLQEQVMMQNSNESLLAALKTHFVDTGLFTRWLVDMTLQMLLLCALSGVCWKYWSATPGKMLFRMQVVDATTKQPLSNQQILLRLWGYVVASLPLFLGFMWIIFNKRRQGWHDKMANSVVIIVSKSGSEAVHP